MRRRCRGAREPNVGQPNVGEGKGGGSRRHAARENGAETQRKLTLRFSIISTMIYFTGEVLAAAARARHIDAHTARIVRTFASF